MSMFKDSFSKLAREELEAYLIQTERNIELFNKVKNNYMDNCEEISKDLPEKSMDSNEVFTKTLSILNLK